MEWGKKAMKTISEDRFWKRIERKRKKGKVKRLFSKVIRFIAFPIVIIESFDDFKRLYEAERAIRHLKSTLREAAKAIRYQSEYYERELNRRTERFMEMLTWEKKHLKREKRSLEIQYQRNLKVLKQFQEVLEAKKK